MRPVRRAGAKFVRPRIRPQPRLLPLYQKLLLSGQERRRGLDAGGGGERHRRPPNSVQRSQRQLILVVGGVRAGRCRRGTTDGNRNVGSTKKKGFCRRNAEKFVQACFRQVTPPSRVRRTGVIQTTPKKTFASFIADTPPTLVPVSETSSCDAVRRE